MPSRITYIGERILTNLLHFCFIPLRIIFTILGVLIVAGTSLDVGKLLLKTLRDESESCHDNHVQDGDRDEIISDAKKQKASDKIKLIPLDSNKVTFIGEFVRIMISP